jgi:hypothetical protein
LRRAADPLSDGPIAQAASGQQDDAGVAAVDGIAALAFEAWSFFCS